MMDIIETIEKHVQSNIPNSIVQAQDLTGNHGSMHLGILVVSEIFAGKGMLEQQQIVMGLLTEFLKEQVHAVQIKTMTPKQYENRNG